LGLDKWIAPEKEKKKPVKKEVNLSPDIILKSKKKENSKAAPILSKYILICPKAKCKYQKVILKRTLTTKDKICPKCKGQMKVK
jgi:hypothetical protein